MKIKVYMVFCFFLDRQFEFIYVNLKCKVEYWQKHPPLTVFANLKVDGRC